MIEINGKRFCENCFAQTADSPCPLCGFDPKSKAVDPTLLSPGSVLKGRYIVGSVIGKGGFGVTYLAYDALWQKKVAIKEYFPYGVALRTESSYPRITISSEDVKETFETGAKKFYEEACLLANFNGNPNIVSVYESFYENDTAYYSMEYLKGKTLKEYIRCQGLLSSAQALYVAKCVVNALTVIHSASVLHRDISPDNIVICEGGKVKLIDFGSARQVIAEYTQNFSTVLKPGFAPLEQYQKKGNQGPWTDVYSIGATLYFALTGDIPEDPAARIDNDETFGANLFDIDSDLWNIIVKATRIQIENRYSDAYEMNRDLKKLSFSPEPLTAPEEQAESSDADAKTPNVICSNFSIVVQPPKKSFFRRHLRTIIEIAAAAAAVAIIIPLALKPNTPIPVDRAWTDENSPFKDFDKPFYSEMDEKERELYEELYLGIKEGTNKIRVTSRKFEVDFVPSVYYRMMYDNPQITDAQNFTYNFSDINNNGNPEPDEYVTYVFPKYIDVDPQLMKDEAEKFMDTLDKSDIIECLRRVHDKLILETDPSPRYENATCTYSYGTIVDHCADDLGMARAMCYYAQQLGAYSYVIDGTFNGKQRAWVRVKLNGSWYNIDVYGDMMNCPDKTKVGEDDSSYKYFLTGDQFILNNGYDAEREGETLWQGDDGTVSPDINYYLSQRK